MLFSFAGKKIFLKLVPIKGQLFKKHPETLEDTREIFAARPLGESEKEKVKNLATQGTLCLSWHLFFLVSVFSAPPSGSLLLYLLLTHSEYSKLCPKQASPSLIPYDFSGPGITISLHPWQSFISINLKSEHVICCKVADGLFNLG